MVREDENLAITDGGQLFLEHYLDGICEYAQSGYVLDAFPVSTGEFDLDSGTRLGAYLMLVPLVI